MPSRRRVRRGFWDGIELKLATPSVNWNKMIGSPKIGAEFGLTIRNEFHMKIGEQAAAMSCPQWGRLH